MLSGRASFLLAGVFSMVLGLARLGLAANLNLEGVSELAGELWENWRVCS
jgi:hypothetical protein